MAGICAGQKSKGDLLSSRRSEVLTHANNSSSSSANSICFSNAACNSCTGCSSPQKAVVSHPYPPTHCHSHSHPNNGHHQQRLCRSQTLLHAVVLPGCCLVCKQKQWQHHQSCSLCTQGALLCQSTPSASWTLAVTLAATAVAAAIPVKPLVSQAPTLATLAAPCRSVKVLTSSRTSLCPCKCLQT